MTLPNARYVYLAVAMLALALLSCSALQLGSPPTTTSVATSTETPAPTLLPASTETLTPAATPTATLPSPTPIPSMTSSPRPTKTSTPKPAWVTDFAQPILDIIDLRTPDFQDDFDDKSGEWQLEGYCAPWRMRYQAGELILTNCGVRRPKLAYTDFVVELDGRFLQSTQDDASWAIFFRDIGGPSYLYGVNLDGSIGLWGFGQEYQSCPSTAHSGYEANHLLLIAKGSKFAFYVNGRPACYLENDEYQWGDIWFRAWSGGSSAADSPAIVAFDNFMLWDVRDVEVP
jgi:hypothetical protein